MIILKNKKNYKIICEKTNSKTNGPYAHQMVEWKFWTSLSHTLFSLPFSISFAKTMEPPLFFSKSLLLFTFHPFTTQTIAVLRLVGRKIPTQHVEWSHFIIYATKYRHIKHSRETSCKILYLKICVDYSTSYKDPF